MARRTTIDDEIDERADYFADWVRRLTDEKDRARVVNDRTARELISEAFSRDMNLSNLLEGMEDHNKGFDSIIKTGYFQDLIEANRTGKKLDVSTAKLRRKRQALEQLIPKKERVARKKVINRFATAKTLGKYNIKKDAAGRYRDSRTGRYVSFDRILRVTDLVILSSAAKRKEFDEFYKKIKK